MSLSAAFLAFALLASGQAPPGPPPAAPPNPQNLIVGTWQAKTENAVVQIDPCGTSVCGRVITSDHLKREPEALDARNHNKALRDRRIAGLVMLQGFVGGPAKWTEGSVYNPNDGGTYHGIIRALDPNRLKLIGCIIYPLCKSEIWTRIR